MAKNPLESSNEIENPIPSSANPLPQSITTNKPPRADQYNHSTIIDILPLLRPSKWSGPKRVINPRPITHHVVRGYSSSSDRS